MNSEDKLYSLAVVCFTVIFLGCLSAGKACNAADDQVFLEGVKRGCTIIHREFVCPKGDTK